MAAIPNGLPKPNLHDTRDGLNPNNLQHDYSHLSPFFGQPPKDHTFYIQHGPTPLKSRKITSQPATNVSKITGALKRMKIESENLPNKN